VTITKDVELTNRSMYNKNCSAACKIPLQWWAWPRHI